MKPDGRQVGIETQKMSDLVLERIEQARTARYLLRTLASPCALMTGKDTAYTLTVDPQCPGDTAARCSTIPKTDHLVACRFIHLSLNWSITLRAVALSSSAIRSCERAATEAASRDSL